MAILRKILLEPTLRVLHKPQIRYSDSFYLLQQAFKLRPREEMLNLAMRYVALSKIDGDYLEFGIYQGETFAAAYHLAQRAKLHSMRFLGFDSFQGLPALKGVDQKGEYQFGVGDYCCDQGTVTSKLCERGVDLTKVDLVAGWFSESLAKSARASIQTSKAAIAWVDCDLYESTVPVLDFLASILCDGAIVIFDDWYCFRGRADMGEQKACTEWLQSNPQITLQQYHRFGWHGNSFIATVKPDGC